MSLRSDETFAVPLAVLCLLTLSCSFGVRQDDLPGRYTADYPFGRETLTLNRDHTFVQQVEIKTEAPASVKGRWEFDSDATRVDLYGEMIVEDGFGQLKPDWRVVKPGVSSLSVRRSVSGITIGGGSEHPYVKE